MQKFGQFTLDREKDMIVALYREKDRLSYVLSTPNHHTGNLITNLAKLCDLELSFDEKGYKVIRGEVPSYIDAYNHHIWIFRLGNTKVANIYEDGSIEMKASIPSISKTLMSQTKDYHLDIAKTIIKTYILTDCKFHSDLHTHMNGNLTPDTLIALGIMHQIRYPLYYVKKLGLRLSKRQEEKMLKERKKNEERFENDGLSGKYHERHIDDNTFINFADLILNNLADQEYNIPRIRASLAILKDGQAVFTNLEKVYLYRYVFTKGIPHKQKVSLRNGNKIHDKEIRETLEKMKTDHEEERYRDNTLFQDKLLWIARTYASQGIDYVEISDTTLVKKEGAVKMLKEAHEVLPKVYEETGVLIRFLAAFRRIPLTLVRDDATPVHYLKENLEVFRSVIQDPYVSGSDIVGEEINDIRELSPLLKEQVKIAASWPGYVLRVHAGENDSLRGNVYNTLQIIRSALKPGQKMPFVRIGHGLFTENLSSKKGRELVRTLKENHVTLEFQISSNVRLNNLNSLSDHPLKNYLRKGIHCVQGTDGAALYGTCPIDEQLSLEKLLELKHEELLKMAKTENTIVTGSIRDFHRKMRSFQRKLHKKSFEEIFRDEMKEMELEESPLSYLSSYSVFKESLQELPWDKIPVVIAGGSFNTEGRDTRMKKEGKQILHQLMDELSPDEVFFVTGYKMKAYEKELFEYNKKGFTVYRMLPKVISGEEKERLLKQEGPVRISPETSGMGIYKSFNYEIFERRPSIVLVFDGNSAAANLIQEARNGKHRSRIYVYEGSPLEQKAQSLRGYVSLFRDEKMLEEIKIQIERIRNGKI